MLLRAAVVGDFPTIMALNDADVAHLSPLTVEALDRLATTATYFRVAEIGGAVAGFLLALSSDAEHDGENFLWFKERYPRFLYIDRVVVASHARRLGVASRLYADIEAHADASDAPLLACEVNVRPPNPDSSAFHDRRGFVAIATRELTNGAKTVSMRTKARATSSPR